MGLIEHAEFELRKAGLFDADSDYNGMLGKAVLELVTVFAKQGHSGFSAGRVRELFTTLADFKPLTPISSDPEEWFDHGEGRGPYGERIWQNKRRGSTFSRDGGRTWYDIDDGTLNNGDVWLRPSPSSPEGERA